MFDRVGNSHKADSFVLVAGMAGPATDFLCRMDCHKGPSAANGAPNVPPEGIFDPPYTINNNLTQVNITVKVCMLAAGKLSMCVG